MRLRKLREDDSAVSPVIGVILMVAITVILAAVIASFVLGLGPGDNAPNARFSFDYTQSTNELVVSHDGGASIPKSRVSIKGSGLNGNTGTWDSVGGTATGSVDGETAIISGDSVTISGVSSGYSIKVIWTAEDGSSTSILAQDEG